MKTKSLKFPKWIKTKAPVSKEYKDTLKLVNKNELNTVCEESSCPNIGECWQNKHITIIILGSICTRSCRFCNVTTGKPNSIDYSEPKRVAKSIKKLKVNHIIITSVNRDDLLDGGSKHFFNTIQNIKKNLPKTTIEILTPDFLRKKKAIENILKAEPDVFNHNVETIPRLYKTFRPGAKYFQSLKILSIIKKFNPKIFTKSGIMLGVGEQKSELLEVMDDLRLAEVDFITIGQYLSPSNKHYPIKKFITPKQFDDYALIGQSKGFLLVSSSPLTRSSYHANHNFKNLKKSKLLIMEKKYFYKK